MERSEQPHLPADGSEGSGAEHGRPEAEAPGTDSRAPEPATPDDPLQPEPHDQPVEITEVRSAPDGPAHRVGLARRPDPEALDRANRESRRWRRKRDYALTALLVVAVLLGGTTLWYFSDARATVSRTATATPGPDTEGGLPAPVAPPTAVKEIWHAASEATPVPVVAKDSVVSADGSTVLGRDPVTGAVRWEYSRNWPLCTVNAAWGKAVTVYRKTRNCSEVTELDGSTGERSAQRNDNADPGTRLITDGTHVVATGHTLADVWRYDLVLTTQYGTIPDGVNPGSQPRTGCRLDTFAISNGRLGVLERCPDESGDRLTVLKTAPKDSDKPEPVFSTLIGGEGRRLVAMSGDVEGVLAAGPTRLVTFDATGAQHGEYPLNIPDADVRQGPADGVSGTTTGTKAIYWFSGSATVALSITDLHPLWTIRGALGPGTLVGGQLLVPVPGGLAVVDPESGAQQRLIPVDRHDYQGVIKMSSAGDVLLEQRGPTLYALR